MLKNFSVLVGKSSYRNSVLVGKSSYRNSIVRAGKMTHQEDLSLIILNYNEEGERTDLPPPTHKINKYALCLKIRFLI